MRKSDLKRILNQIDGRPYPAYKDTRGRYDLDDYTLSIDHVQGDPFAAPSDLSIEVRPEKAAFPAEALQSKETRRAVADQILRNFGKALKDNAGYVKGSGKSGKLSVSKPGQEILERTSITLNEDGSLRVRFNVGFPANGRRILARELDKILFDTLPKAASQALMYENYDVKARKQIEKAWKLAEDQKAMRQQMAVRDLVAFVADGAILPRESGISDKPMKGAVPFESPDTLRVSLEAPYGGSIAGMGIPKGITLIAGGGYHGKSTLLEAIEKGVYDHIEGDGREYVLTEDNAVKSRAEDGRSIQDVNISGFITNLPNNKDTHAFYTEDASGSTSQAASLAEALEAGSRVILMDEDTSAANFMIRDNLMQEVIHKDKEPIIPFVDRIQELRDDLGISTILVAGSSGAFFDKADTIIQMDAYKPLDITEKAKEAASRYHFESRQGLEPFTYKSVRVPMPVKESGRSKVKSRGLDTISIDRQEIDMRLVEQLTDPEQLTAIGQLLRMANRDIIDGKKTVTQVVDEIEKRLDEKPMDQTVKGHGARPRRQELFAAIDRQRYQPIKTPKAS